MHVPLTFGCSHLDEHSTAGKRRGSASALRQRGVSLSTAAVWIDLSTAAAGIGLSTAGLGIFQWPECTASISQHIFKILMLSEPKEK